MFNLAFRLVKKLVKQHAHVVHEWIHSILIHKYVPNIIQKALLKTWFVEKISEDLTKHANKL